MKEKIYTIPVNDAFDADYECPICYMKKVLEEDAINYVLGPSYMEDDVRTATNELGFCSYHIEELSTRKNTLGLALMLHTHMIKSTKDMKKLVPSNNSGLFKKKADPSALIEYIKKLQHSCYVCDKVNITLDRYMDTILMLWDKEETFREKFKNCKGFCTNHFGVLYEASTKKFSGKKYDLFIEELSNVYFENIQRVSDDLDWFIKKFEYQNQNESWKSSRDAVPRTIIKMNGKK